MPTSQPITADADLLAAARRDPNAFRDLYDRYAERIYGYFVRRSGNPEAAVELTAETFAEAWQFRTRFRDEADGSAAPWLYGIARNVLLMSLRRGELERRASQQLGIAERLDIPFEASVSPDERWADGADELLETLSPSLREAVRLRVVQELDYEKVGAELGTSASTARVRVHRGLAALRNRFSDSKEMSQ